MILRHTVLGVYIYAVGGNSDAARLSGIKVPLILIFVYGISGLLGGLGGARYWLLLSFILPLAGTLWIALGEWLGRAASKQLATLIPRLASIVLGLFAVLLVAA